MDAQVQSIVFEYPREYNVSVNDTVKNGTGKFLPMHRQEKYSSCVHPREYKRSISNIEKCGAGG